MPAYPTLALPEAQRPFCAESGHTPARAAHAPRVARSAVARHGGRDIGHGRYRCAGAGVTEVTRRHRERGMRAAA
jgi:hypothetical protein